MSDAPRRANVATAREYLEAINRWDFAVMRRLLHAQIVYDLPYAPLGFARRTEGLESVMAFLETIPAAVVDGSENLHDFRIEAFASDPNELLAEYKSDMRLLPAGRRYQNSYMTRFSMKEGKICRFQEYFDPICLVTALGGEVRGPAG